MPRPRTSQPKIYFHTQSARYCVNLSGVRTPLGRTMQEAQDAYPRVVGEWLLQGRQTPIPVRQAQPGASVATVLLTYWRHVQGRVCAKQVARVKAALGAANRLYGAQPAESFDQLALQAIRADLLSRPDSRSGGLRARLWDALAAGPVRPRQLARLFRGTKPDALRHARKALGVVLESQAGKQVYRLPESSQRPASRLLARSYVNCLVRCLQRAWTWLESQKMVPAGSAAALRTVEALKRQEEGRETAPVLPVSDEVVAATIPHAGTVLAAMIRVSQLTGARPEEVCRMRPRDISQRPDQPIRVPLPDGKSFSVSAVEVEGGLVWVYVPESHKTLHRSKARVIVLGPQAQAVLTPFLERPADAYLFSPKEAADEWRRANGRRTKYGKGRQPGPRFSSDAYGKAVRKAARKAGVEEWTPGRLRHSRATDLVEASDHDTAAAFLGHSRPDQTAHYSLQAVKKAAAIAAKIG